MNTEATQFTNGPSNLQNMPVQLEPTQECNNAIALQQENAQLKAQQLRMIQAIQSFHSKFQPVKGQNFISIRNFPSAVAEDPKTAIMDLLKRLSIHAADHQVRIVACNELFSNKPLHQIYLEFMETHLQIQLIGNFSQLSNDEDEMLRKLELRDPQETEALYKQAFAKRTGKLGVVFLNNKNNQVLVQLSGEKAPSELSTLEEIEAIATRIDEAHERRKMQLQQLRCEQSEGHQVLKRRKRNLEKEEAGLTSESQQCHHTPHKLEIEEEQ